MFARFKNVLKRMRKADMCRVVLILFLFTDQLDIVTCNESERTDCTSLITLFLEPRTVEEAAIACKKEKGVLFTSQEFEHENNWLLVVSKLFKTLIERQQGISLMYRINSLQAHGTSAEVIVDRESCRPDNLPANDGVYKVISASEAHIDMHLKMIYNNISPVDKRPFVCIKNIRKGCRFNVYNDVTIEGDINSTYPCALDSDVEKVLGLVSENYGYWLMEYDQTRNICSSFLPLKQELIDVNQIVSHVGKHLYYKDCFEGIVYTPTPSEERSHIGYYSMEMYCPLDLRVKTSEDCGENTTTSTPTSDKYQLTGSEDIVLKLTARKANTAQSSVFNELVETLTTGSSINPSPVITADIDTELLETSFDIFDQVTHSVSTEPLMSGATELNSTTVASVLASNSTVIDMQTKTSIAGISSTSTMEDTSCDCTCIVKVLAIPDPTEFISSIVHDLEIDKTMVARNKNRYRSVDVDHRWQTLGVGYFGITFVILLFGGIILMDVNKLFRDFKGMLQNLSHMWSGNQSALAIDHSTKEKSNDQERIMAKIERDTERYRAIVAEILAERQLSQLKTGRVRVDGTGRQRPTNKDKHDPRVGRYRTDIYNSN